jgi:hypothetical protein
MGDPVREGRELYGAGRLHGTWSAQELLARVDALEACRKALPAKRKRVWLLLFGCISAIVVFAILSSVLPHEGTVSGIVGPVCSLVIFIGIVGAVASIVMLIMLGLRKYDEDAAAVLGTVARCLGPDLAKGALFKVNACLRNPTDSALLVRTSGKYATDKYPECVDRFFKRDILDLECRLRDGTRLLAVMVEHTVEKVLKKKNPRGKWKTKRKCRRKIGIRVRLLLDETRCRLTGNLKVPEGTAVRVRHHPRGALVFLSQRTNLPDSRRLGAGTLLSLLSGVYGAVTMVEQSEQNFPGGIQ